MAEIPPAVAILDRGNVESADACAPIEWWGEPEARTSPTGRDARATISFSIFLDCIRVTNVRMSCAVILRKAEQFSPELIWQSGAKTLGIAGGIFASARLLGTGSVTGIFDDGDEIVGHGFPSARAEIGGEFLY